MSRRALIIFFTVLTVPVTAHAAPRDALQPTQTGPETVRYDRGEYIVDLPGSRAAVQLRSVADGNGYSFDVVVLNAGSAPINIDVGNIHILGTQEPVTVMTRAALQHKAEHHAQWQKIWSTLGTSLVAAGQASQRNHYYINTSTPFGNYNSTISAPCYSCQAAANYTLAAGAARNARIQDSLDQTRAMLGAQAFQLSTINPGQAYGGRVFLSRFKHTTGGEMRLVVDVNGEPFTFGFRFAPEGSPAPSYRMAAATAPVSPVAAQYSAPPMTYPVAPSPLQMVALAPAPSPPVPSYSLMPAAFVTPASSDTTLANRQPVPRVGYETLRKWHHYYDSMVQNGTPKADAKEVADGEFGPID